MSGRAPPGHHRAGANLLGAPRGVWYLSLGNMETDSSVLTALVPGYRAVVTVQDIAFGGEGVARLNDLVIFVPFVLVGEEVEIEITEVKKSFARARLVRVLQASADRVTPRCRYFRECGGCQYQHLAYPKQLEVKRKQIADLFQRIGGFTEAVVDPVVPCPQPYGYRNRIMVRSQWDKFKQGLNLGFIRHDNRLVVDLEECPIAEPALNTQLLEVRRHPPPKGGLKVVLRLAPEGWEVPRDSFFQNNFFLLPRLVEAVRDRLRDGGVRHLVDAYCGVGFFGIELADAVASFVGIELDAMAVRAARRNAAERSRGNGEFREGRVEDLLPEYLGRWTASDTAVILDPPRKGCPASGLSHLRAARPAQVLYVSCHPATLARDLNLLCREGIYELVKVVPLDMFPQTQHVECVADVRARRGA
jgi:tRNA/tmRNA/rRNA uracil-C5-methylase (TrmA/RlmC/RlmD family)